MPRIEVSTIYGHKHKMPIVEIRFPKQPPDTPKERRNLVQLSVDEARDLALNLLGAAESAIQDAFVVEFSQELGLDERQAIMLLRAFRERRHDRQDDTSA